MNRSRRKTKSWNTVLLSTAFLMMGATTTSTWATEPSAPQQAQAGYGEVVTSGIGASATAAFATKDTQKAMRAHSRAKVLREEVLTSQYLSSGVPLWMDPDEVKELRAIQAKRQNSIKASKKAAGHLEGIAKGRSLRALAGWVTSGLATLNLFVLANQGQGLGNPAQTENVLKLQADQLPQDSEAAPPQFESGSGKLPAGSALR